MAKSLWLVSLFWIAANALPQSTPLGGAPGTMQRAGFGAKNHGLGNASVALIDAASGFQTNPALLAMTSESVLHLGGSLLSLGRREGFLAYKQRVRAKTALGFSWVYRDIPEFDLRNDDEEIVGRSSENFHGVQAGLAYRPRRSWSAGVGINYYKQNVYQFSSSAIGLIDLGLCFLPRKTLSIGLSVRNLPFLSGNVPWQVSTGTDWNAVADLGLPYQTKAGLCYEGKWKGRAYRVVMEEDGFFWKNEDSPRWRWAHSEHAGLEAWITPKFALRAGYDRGRFPLGFGINDIWKGAVLDYCFVFERNVMGVNHSVEWGWSF